MESNRDPSLRLGILEENCLRSQLQYCRSQLCMLLQQPPIAQLGLSRFGDDDFIQSIFFIRRPAVELRNKAENRGKIGKSRLCLRLQLLWIRFQDACQLCDSSSAQGLGIPTKILRHPSLHGEPNVAHGKLVPSAMLSLRQF